nr:MAG TPA: hypothetical protein [Caudoviricetes sp.]
MLWNACFVQGKETNMDFSKFMILLKQHRKYLTFQQFRTLKGQARAGDVDAAFKGLQKLLQRRSASC